MSEVLKIRITPKEAESMLDGRQLNWRFRTKVEKAFPEIVEKLARKDRIGGKLRAKIYDLVRENPEVVALNEKYESLRDAEREVRDAYWDKQSAVRKAIENDGEFLTKLEAEILKEEEKESKSETKAS